LTGGPGYIFVWLALLWLASVDGAGVVHPRSSVGVMESVNGVLKVDIL
jgi:hypothetical protein